MLAQMSALAPQNSASGNDSLKQLKACNFFFCGTLGLLSPLKAVSIAKTDELQVWTDSVESAPKVNLHRSKMPSRSNSKLLRTDSTNSLTFLSTRKWQDLLSILCKLKIVQLIDLYLKIDYFDEIGELLLVLVVERSAAVARLDVPDCQLHSLLFVRTWSRTETSSEASVI